MATGTAAGLACFATQAEAAARFCASAVGVTSGGVVSCDGADSSAALSSTSGGDVLLPWVMRVQPATGSPVLSVVSTQLHACERYDLTYWSPWITAWVVALAVVLGVKLATQRVFTRESL